MGVYIISAWVLALSVQQDWAMREPQDVGRTARISSHVFFMCVIETNQLMPNRGAIGYMTL